MTKLTFMLVLYALVLVFWMTPLFRGSRRQKQYEKEGMRILAWPRKRIVVLPAMAVFCTGMVAVFTVLMWQDIGPSGMAEIGWFWVLLGTVVLLDAVCFLAAYILEERHILYNEEKLLIGQPFREYREIRWYEISSMQIKNQDFFSLYDRDGRRFVQASAYLKGYGAFYQEALLRVHPEQDVAAGEKAAYTSQFLPVNGCGKLQPRAGEYWALLVVSVVMLLFLAAAGLEAGVGVGEMVSAALEEGIYGILIVPAFFVGSILGLVRAQEKKITYDRTEIAWYRFGQKRKSLRRADIVNVTSAVKRNGLRTLTITTTDGQYQIREAEFRRGYSEFCAEFEKVQIVK